MKNYKLNDELIRDAIYNGCRTTFMLTSKYCKDTRLVRDEPLFDGFNVLPLEITGADYLIVRSLKDSIHFKKGNIYVFRIAYLSGKRFFLTPANKYEINSLGYGERNERT